MTPMSRKKKSKNTRDIERADISKTMKEDAKAEVQEENEQNERLGEEEIRADYKLPPGWPLDYPK